MSGFGSNLELVEIGVKVKDEIEMTRFELLNNKLNQCKYNYRTIAFGKGLLILFFADVKRWKDPRDVDQKALEEFGS